MKRSISWSSVLPSLVIPVCLGLMMYIGLLHLIRQGIVSDPTVLRYLMGHWISEASTAMFLVGMASLLMIALDVFQQFRKENRIHLSGLGEFDDDAEFSRQSEIGVVNRAVELGKQLKQLPGSLHDHYLWTRLNNLLQFIYHQGSAVKVDDESKYLADSDSELQQRRYSLVQILVWATPMLGFLGTVFGISQALGGISVGPENDFQSMMDGLKASLYVAFDTTALALILSIGMMFSQFLVDRFEAQLLQLVNRRAHAEIAAQFDLSVADQNSPRFEASLINCLQNATEKQTTLWREAIRQVEAKLGESVHKSQKNLVANLTTTVDQCVGDLANSLGESISRADQAMSHRWEQWQVLLSDNARQTSKHQLEFASQSNKICELLERTAKVSNETAAKMTDQISAQIELQKREVAESKAKANADELKSRLAAEELKAKASAQELKATLAAEDLKARRLEEELKARLAAEELKARRLEEELKARLAADELKAQALADAAESESASSWGSVSPDYLCVSGDHDQVVLPIRKPNPPSPQTQTVSNVAEQDDEVVLPVFKRTA